MSADQEPHILTSIMRLKSRLSDLIEPFELLDQLLSLQFLTRRQYNKIRTGDKAAEEQNEALLDLLTSPDQRSKFLEALRNTGQQHIINLITQRGGQRGNISECATCVMSDDCVCLSFISLVNPRVPVYSWTMGQLFLSQWLPGIRFIL